MKNDLTCEVVRDLLPSYVDGLTNDVSNQAVEQHIKICENCRKLYHEMQETVNGEYLSEQDLEQMGRKADFKVPSEIDYLKKIRRKKIRKRKIFSRIKSSDQALQTIQQLKARSPWW